MLDVNFATVVSPLPNISNGSRGNRVYAGDRVNGRKREGLRQYLRSPGHPHECTQAFTGSQGEGREVFKSPYQL